MPAARGRRSSVVTSYAESPSSDDETDVTTRPAKRARTGDSSDDDDDDDVSFSGARKAKKKAKKPAKKSRAKPKGTDRFTPLPLDPLLEILRHVDAVSLIHLRETSRTLYRLLSGPDGAPIWSHALAEEGLPVLKAGLLTPWQYAEIALWKRCTNCTGTQFIPDFYVLRRYCRVCRKGTLFRLDHLKKNYPDAHPCTKLCVLASHCKFYVCCHAFRDDFETLDEHLWSLQAQDDADSSLRPSGSRTITRKTTTKRSPDEPLPGSRVAKFVKERQRAKEFVEQDAKVAQSHRSVAGVRI
ncbi:hypothetical protein RHOSPDRAFT_25512 [Rhodotorula sp. JG-1b]|nr:hypothetical protein RHOSPDRAFT_25512 [Rhodotorula sp. JG-1b]